MQVVDDQGLIERVKTTACSDSLKELIKRHSGICFKVFSRYIPTIQDKGKDYQDLASNKDYFIYQAAITYKEHKKARFSTWLGNYVRYKCLDFLNESNFYFCSEPRETETQINKNSAARFEEQFDLVRKKECVFDILFKLKDKRIQKIYKLRYFTIHPKMPWKKIGENIGVSTQTVINLHEKGKNFIKTKAKGKNIFF